MKGMMLAPMLGMMLGMVAGCGSKGDPGGGISPIEPPPPPESYVLEPWQEGWLDIHAINTGRGESTLYIFPDGTTMLVDVAGSLYKTTPGEVPPTPPRPDETVTSGRVILNYIEHFAGTNGGLDYLVLSHWDPDHMGDYRTTQPMAPEGNFRLGGVTEVGTALRVGKIIDRGYLYPKNRANESRMVNYRKFVEWAAGAYGTTREEFDVGSAGQIILKRDAEKYPDFEIRNLFANGYVWTGEESGGRVNTFPSVEEIVNSGPKENIYCAAFHLRWGRFDYYAGGDLQYSNDAANPWWDVEKPVAAVVPRVDVMKANHHGTSGCNGTPLLGALAPRTVVIQTWRDVQANAGALERMFAASGEGCNIFITNTTEANHERLAAQIPRLKSLQGHVVVRVRGDEGRSYMVYVLDDTNEQYRVVKEAGPYASF